MLDTCYNTVLFSMTGQDKPDHTAKQNDAKKLFKIKINIRFGLNVSFGFRINRVSDHIYNWREGVERQSRNVKISFVFKSN